MMLGWVWGDEGVVERVGLCVGDGGRTYSVGRTFWTIHDDVPVVDVGFIDEIDLDTCWWVLCDLCQLLL